MIGIENFTNSSGNILCTLIRAEASSPGINFITHKDNSFQIALMTRNTKSPVNLHEHLHNNRTIWDTQEVIIVKSGMLEVEIYENLNSDDFLHKFKLLPGDLVHLISGAHKINFLLESQIIEIKQGPYLELNDKKYKID